jgi:hypothetical protein
MIKAPVKKREAVARTCKGCVGGIARGAASKVEKRHGK